VEFENNTNFGIEKELYLLQIELVIAERKQKKEKEF
jgi:hypothetical protein